MAALRAALDLNLLDHPLNEPHRPGLKGRGLKEDLLGERALRRHSNCRVSSGTASNKSATRP